MRWKPADDDVLPPIFSQEYVPARKVPEKTIEAPRETARQVIVQGMESLHAERDRAVVSQMREREILVARELAGGRDPEAYWNDLCDAFNARASATQELNELGVETPFDRSVIQKIRWEMNALIPRLAEARVRRDARIFSDPRMYANRLRAQYEHAERTVALAEGDEIALRSAIDNARIAHEQLSALRKLTPRPDSWMQLRKEAIRGAERSVLEDLPSAVVETKRWRIELAGLQAERAKLGFWNVLKKMELDAKISTLLRREAYEARKAGSIAGTQ